MTKVINLYAGSGSGKSTCAAALFAEMKMCGLEAELVREYVKSWSWMGKSVQDMDQLYLLGKQTAYEKILYGKVDFVVTDSPVLICGVYEAYRSGGKRNYAGEAGKAFLTHAKDKGVEHINYFLNRKKPFNTKGRYETEEQAKAVDVFMKEYLDINNINYKIVDCDDRERVAFIMKDLGLV